MSTILLDSHVLYWLTSEPARISLSARAEMSSAELVVSDVTWFELAWRAAQGRILTAIPTPAWLQRLATSVRTEPVTPPIAIRAASLPEQFPRDPADRLIYATAVENGWKLVTKDRRIRSFAEGSSVVVW